MKYAKIVVDVGYGDSGKGVVVDNLCSDKSLVVRFSGGHQCGHTVIRDGIKHIFSSFGAGSLKGCPTYFTEDTTMYLNSLLTERDILREKGINPKLYLHPLTNITTPYDIFFNRVSEKRNNHGSCGLGYSATMKRNIETPYKLYAIDLTNKKVFLEKLKNIKAFYKNKVIDELIFNLATQKHIKETIMEQEEQFFDSIDRIQTDCPFEISLFDRSFYDQFDDVVFEGSQGIMLDMDHGFFPNVTYANTTSKNAMKYCDKMCLNPDIFYVTRCYQTRHGNGYMSNESHIDLINNEEEINVTNEYQGNFRIGEVDYDQIRYALNVDCLYHIREVNSLNMVITCVDQRPEFIFDMSRFTNIQTIYWNNSATCGNMYK